MSNSISPSPDDFHSGHLVVDSDRNIVFCNTYICQIAQAESSELIGASLSGYFTKASNIFIDSYIYPLLLSDSLVQETQLNWLSVEGDSIPVTANIKLAADGNTYWSLYTCANRDKLQGELIKAREILESQSKELLLLASTDSLTGLLNRRAFAVQAKKLVSHLLRGSSVYAVLSIDIDFFKRVNDTYGHKIGDKVLRHLAQVLSSERRAHDLVARTGGEEFVMLLPELSAEHALEFAERLRRKIAAQPIESLSITVSLGVAVSDPEHPSRFEQLLDWSDKALYDSKNQGRNRTTLRQGFSEVS